MRERYTYCGYEEKYTYCGYEGRGAVQQQG